MESTFEAMTELEIVLHASISYILCLLLLHFNSSWKNLLYIPLTSILPRPFCSQISMSITLQNWLIYPMSCSLNVHSSLGRTDQMIAQQQAMKLPGTVDALLTLNIFLEFRVTRKPCSRSFSEVFNLNILSSPTNIYCIENTLVYRF